MNTQTLANLIGCTGQLRVERFSVPVSIVDARTAFGRIDVQVSPTGGHGIGWVSLDRVRMDDESNATHKG